MTWFILIGIFCVLAVVGFFVTGRPFKFAIGGIIFLIAFVFVSLVVIVIWTMNAPCSAPFTDHNSTYCKNQAVSIPVSSSALSNTAQQTNNEIPNNSTQTNSDNTQFPQEKCVTESGVKICDLSHSIQQTFGDGTRNVSFQANAIDCVNVATGSQKQSQGNVIQVDSGNTYCASDLGAVYIDPTILVAKYFNTITQNSDSSYQVPATYGTCLWTYAGGSADVPYVEVSGSVGPSTDFYSVRAFCQNGSNQVDIYSYKDNS